MSLGDWWFDKYPNPVSTCAESLVKVHCPSKYHICIKNVKSYYNDKSGCDRMRNNDAKDRLKQLCNKKRSCSPDTSRDSDLFHKRFATIQYGCRGNHDKHLYRASFRAVNSETKCKIRVVSKTLMNS